MEGSLRLGKAMIGTYRASPAGGGARPRPEVLAIALEVLPAHGIVVRAARRRRRPDKQKEGLSAAPSDASAAAAGSPTHYAELGTMRVVERHRAARAGQAWAKIPERVVRQKGASDDARL